MATITERGPFQFRVEIRRQGVKVPRQTFETRKAAEDWATVMEGKVVGGEYKGVNLADTTTVLQALEWYEKEIIPKKPKSAKNKRCYCAYWKASRFASWKMSALMPWDLVDWRRDVLDQDNAIEDEQVGPASEWAVQTCWHYLQLLSHLFTEWAFAHKLKLDNPVSEHVRPVLNDGRDRRLDHEADTDGNDEEARLLAATSKSKSMWLSAAVRISLETGMRQAELAGLTWNRVRLDVTHPYADLMKTKNERARRVPFSTRAIAALKTLGDPAMPYAVSEVRALNRGSPINTVLGVETSRAIIHAFNEVVTEKAFPDLHWHDLRHEAISRLFENTDLRDQEIMAIVGHLSTESLKRYTHLRAHRLGPRLG